MPGWVAAASFGRMAKTSVELDPVLLRHAKAVLGTRSMRATVNAALQEVVDGQRRRELIDLLREPGRFDFYAADSAWGADE